MEETVHDWANIRLRDLLAVRNVVHVQPTASDAAGSRQTSVTFQGLRPNDAAGPSTVAGLTASHQGTGNDYRGQVQLQVANAAGTVVPAVTLTPDMVTMNGSLVVNGQLNLGVNSNFQGNVSLAGKLSVTGSGTFSSGLNVKGATTVDKAATLEGPVSVAGAATFGNDVNVMGALRVTGAALWRGPTTDVAGALAVTGLVTVGGPAGVDGAVTVVGSSQVGGAAGVAGPLNVTAGTTFGSTLNVSSTVALGTGVDLPTTLGVSGITTVKGSTTDVGGQLSVAGSTSLRSALALLGATALAEQLVVSGHTTIAAGSGSSSTGGLGVPLPTYAFAAGAGGAATETAGGGAGGVVVTRTNGQTGTVEPTRPGYYFPGFDGDGFGAGGAGMGEIGSGSWYMTGGHGAPGFVYILGNGTEVFTETDQTYTVPQTGPLVILLMGGGGGGGLYYSRTAHTAGGGAGYITAVTVASVAAGTVLTITVGTGGITDGATVTDGGLSSVSIAGGATYIAAGGRNGNASNSGGAGSSSGGDGRDVATTDGYSGGNGPTGMGATAFNTAISTPSTAGTGGGGGGGGSGGSGGGTVAVGGAVTLRNALAVSAGMGVSGLVTMGNDVNVGAALDVMGSAVLKSTVGVAGSLIVSGAAALKDNLLVRGALGVTGAARVQDNLTVIGALTGSGAATFRATLDVESHTGPATDVLVAYAPLTSASMTATGTLLGPTPILGATTAVAADGVTQDAAALDLTSNTANATATAFALYTLAQPLTSGPTGLTVSLWFKPAVANVNYQYMLDTGIPSSTGSFAALTLCLNSTNLYTSVRGAGVSYDISTPTPATGAWHHVALVVGAGSPVRLYLNGVEVGASVSNFPASATLQAIDNATPTHLRLGGDVRATGTYAYKGLLDEFRVYQRALLLSEVTALCSQRRTVAVQGDAFDDLTWRPSVHDGIISRMTFEPASGPVDTMGLLPNGKLVGSATYSTDARIGTRSLDCTANTAGSTLLAYTQYETPSPATLLQLPVTAACWFKPSAVNVSYQFVFDLGSETEYCGLNFAMQSGSVYTTVNVNGSQLQAIYNNGLTANTWHHVAVVVGAGAPVRLYINGALQASSAGSAAAAGNLTGHLGGAIKYLRLGGDPRTGQGQGFKGLIDDFRLYRKVLDAADVAALYAFRAAAADLEVSLPLRLPFDQGSATPLTKVEAYSVVQQYPPAAMTASTLTLAIPSLYPSYAPGTFTASASSFWNANGTQHPPYQAFNKSNGPALTEFWHTADQSGSNPQLYNSTGDYVGTASTTARDPVSGSAVAYTGEWLQLQLPAAVRFAYYDMAARNGYLSMFPRAWVLLGSVDGLTWDLLDSRTGITVGNANPNAYRPATAAMTAYSFIRLVATKAAPGQVALWGQTVVAIGEMNIYGAEALAVPADMWTPVQVYPPVALAGLTQAYTESAMYAGGTYTVTASSQWDAPLQAWKAFEKVNAAHTDAWHIGGAFYSTTTGAYIGSVSTTQVYDVATGTQGAVAGEWLQLQLPAAVRLFSYQLAPRVGIEQQSPYTWQVLGSVNGVTWDKLDQRTAFTFPATAAQTFNLAGSATATAYAYLRLVVQAKRPNAPDGFMSVGTWDLFGREATRLGTATFETADAKVGNACLNLTSNPPADTGAAHALYSVPGGLDLHSGLSVAVWFKPSGTTGYQFIFDAGNPSQIETFSCLMSGAAAGINVCVDGTMYGFNMVAVAANTWYHLAAVFAPGALGVLYLNGVPVATSVNAGTGVSTAMPVSGVASRNGYPVTALRVGARVDRSMAFQGLVDDLRVYRRALPSSEVQALYAFKGPDLQARVPWALAAPTDLQGFLGTPTVLGSPAYTRNTVVGEYALDLTGNTAGSSPADAFLRYPVPATSLELPAAVAFWFRPSVVNVSYQSVVDAGSAAAREGLTFGMQNGGIFGNCHVGTTKFTATFGSGLIADMWHHVAVVAAPQMPVQLYINGSLVGASANTLPAAGTLTGNTGAAIEWVTVGADAAGNQATKALYADLRLYRRRLTAKDVATLYRNVPTKGSLTVGGAVTVTSNLEVAGSLTDVRVYPSAALTANTTAVTGQPYGNGTYVVTASSQYEGGVEQAWNAFDLTLAPWTSQSSLTANYSTSNVGPSNTTITGGDWLQITLPRPIQLDAYTIMQVYETDRFPKVFYVLGSNNGGTSWTVVDYRNLTVCPAKSTETVSFKVPGAPALYSTYRLHVQQTTVNTYWRSVNWGLWGREAMGAFDVGGTATLLHSLQVTGALAVTGAVAVKSSLEVSGTLGVTGGVVLQSALDVSGTLGASGAATLRSSLEVNGTLAASGSATLRSSLGVGDKLDVTGAATLRSSLNVWGHAWSRATVQQALVVRSTAASSLQGLALMANGDRVVAGAAGAATTTLWNALAATSAGTILSAAGSGTSTAYVARVSATTGAVAWAAVLDGAGADQGVAVAVDPASGAVFVAVQCTGASLSVGHASGPVARTLNRGAAAAVWSVLVKYTSTGDVAWAAQLEGADAGALGFTGLAVVGAQVVATGTLAGTTVAYSADTTATAAKTYSLSLDAATGVFVAAYAVGSGAFQWGTLVDGGTVADVAAMKLAGSPDGVSVYVLAYASDADDVALYGPGGAVAQTLTVPGPATVVARINAATGMLQQAAFMTGVRLHDVAVDPGTGAVVVAGQAAAAGATVTLAGGDIGPSWGAGSGPRAVVAKLVADLSTAVWRADLQGAGAEAALAVAVDTAGAVVLGVQVPEGAGSLTLTQADGTASSSAALMADATLPLAVLLKLSATGQYETAAQVENVTPGAAMRLACPAQGPFGVNKGVVVLGTSVAAPGARVLTTATDSAGPGTTLATLGTLAADAGAGILVQLSLAMGAALAVGGTVASKGDSVNVFGELATSGLATLRSAAGVAGALKVTGATLVRSTVEVAAALAVTGAALLRSSLTVAGSLTVTGAAATRSGLTVSGPLAVTGAALLRSSLSVSGSFTQQSATGQGGTIEGRTVVPVTHSVAAATLADATAYATAKAALIPTTGLALHLHLDGNLTDAQGFLGASTVTGTVAYSGQARAGSRALDFAANTAGATAAFWVGHSLAGALPTVPTVSHACWFYTRDVAANRQVLWALGDEGTTHGSILYLTGANLRFFTYIGGQSFDVIGPNVSAYLWYHAAVVITAGGSIQLYVNGALAATLPGVPATGAFQTYTNTALTRHSVGAYPNTGGTGAYSGLLDDVRLYTRALTLDEITRLAQVSIPGLNTLLSLDGTLMDGTGRLGVGTMTGTAVYTANARTGGSSLDVGANPITTGAGSTYASWTLGTTPVLPLTLACWFYAASTAGSAAHQVIACLGADATFPSWGYELILTPAGLVACDLYLSGTNYAVASSAAVANNRWHHLCSTVSAGGEHVLYLNGTPVSRMSVPAGVVLTAANGGAITQLRIGSQTGNYTPFKGWIDDVRVYGRALDVDDVACLAGLPRSLPALPSQVPTVANGALVFDKAQSQWLNLGPQMFTVASTGFSVTAVAKFNASPVSGETIFAADTATWDASGNYTGEYLDLWLGDTGQNNIYFRYKNTAGIPAPANNYGQGVFYKYAQYGGGWAPGSVVYVTYTLSSGGVMCLYVNGALVQTTSTGFAVTNLAASRVLVGRDLATGGSTPLGGSVYFCQAYNATLTAAQVQVQHAALQAQLASLTAPVIRTLTVGEGARYDAAHLGYTPIVQLHANRHLEAWANAASTRPLFDREADAVFFDRNQSHYLDAGSKTFTTSTTGFTVTTMLTFRGTPGSYERIIDFGSGNPNNNILLYRVATSNDLIYSYFNSNVQNYVQVSGVLAFNVQMVITGVISATGKLTVYVNGVQVGTATSATPPTSRTVSGTYVGKSWWGDPSLSADIAFLGCYNATLTATEVQRQYQLLSGQASSVAGDFTVTGAAVVQSSMGVAGSLAVTGGAQMRSDLAVSGASTLVYDRLPNVTAVDVDNYPVFQDSTIDKVVDGSDGTMWNTNTGGPITYRIQLTLAGGNLAQVNRIRVQVSNDIVHTPTAFRAYADRSKTQLLASQSGTMSANGGQYIFTLSAPYYGSVLYLEFDKSTQYQMYLVAVDLYAARSALAVSGGVLLHNVASTTLPVPSAALSFEGNLAAQAGAAAWWGAPTSTGTPQYRAEARLTTGGAVSTSLRLPNTAGGATTHSVTYPFSPVLSTATGLTISMWFKVAQMPSGSDYHLLCLGGQWTEATGIGLFFRANDLILYFQHTQGAYPNNVAQPASVPGVGAWAANTWYHVVGTVSTTESRLYVNGVRVSRIQGTYPAFNLTSLFLGGRINAGLAAGDVEYDDLQLYQSALSDATIKSLYQSYLGTGVKGPLGVNGDATFTGAAALVAGAVSVSGVATLQSTLGVSGTLGVTGATLLRSSLGVAGAFTGSAAMLQDTLGVSGVTTLRHTAGVVGTVDVTGSAVLRSSLEVIGDVTVDQAVTLQSTLGVSGSVDVSGATVVHSSLGVSGRVALEADVEVVGTLGVTGGAVFQNTMIVQNALSLTGTLGVSDALTVTGAAVFRSNVGVNGDVVVAGNLSVFGNNTVTQVPTVRVADTNVELGKLLTAPMTDLTANGGGVTVKGTTDKTITYDMSHGTGGSWVFSENVYLAASKVLTFNGDNVTTRLDESGLTVSTSLVLANANPGSTQWRFLYDDANFRVQRSTVSGWTDMIAFVHDSGNGESIFY